MKVLITGICGFVGSSLALAIQEAGLGWEISGLDNFIRPGSEENRRRLQAAGIAVRHADLRAASDFESLPAVDWVIDAAANPSVLAGADGHSSSRQVVEHNFNGTINLLEFCKRVRAGFILLSTSRVYSIAALATLPVSVEREAFVFTPGPDAAAGVSAAGIREEFSTQAPISLYGSTKLASEVLALEYGALFGFPVWINRCGVMAGAGQFGRADQGIFAYWIHSHRQRRKLRYIGFGGRGHQVRDCLHPRDLIGLLQAQTRGADATRSPILHLSGGQASAMSLAQLNAWCDERFGPHPVTADPAPRPFDLPWVVLDPTRAAREWQWQPVTPVGEILEEIARQAEARPDWLDLSAG